MSEYIGQLQQVVDAEWARIKGGRFWKLARENMTLDLYREMLVQIYHYTRYNSINQATAAVRVEPSKTGLLKFMFRHALEELGHETMALRDLKSLGELDEQKVTESSPLPATQALIGYLSHVAADLGGEARLGYSFWAEDSYDQFGDLLSLARSKLGLTNDNLTFFVAHSNIDAKHSAEVQREIERWVLTDEQKRRCADVARTTLYLTGCILEQVADEQVRKLVKG
jgi:hypothetical protein